MSAIDIEHDVFSLQNDYHQKDGRINEQKKDTIKKKDLLLNKLKTKINIIGKKYNISFYYYN